MSHENDRPIRGTITLDLRPREEQAFRSRWAWAYYFDGVVRRAQALADSQKARVEVRAPGKVRPIVIAFPRKAA